MAALKGVKPWNGHYFSWMKVFMFSLLDIDADIVIFIDSDTVVSGSLYDLMHQDMEDNVISMVLDLLTSRHKMKIGMDSADSYYNVGVMKIDLQKWKLHFQDFISYLEKENSNNIAEQDAINIFFKGKIKTLEPEWNYFSGYYAYGVDNILRATDLTDSNFYSKHLIMSKYYSPKIIHSTFGIAGKPWEINNKHPNFYQWDKYIKIGETYFEMMKFSKAKPTLTWCAYALLPRKLFMFLYKMKVEKKFG
ncbi:MAG: hypothetical protein LBT69_01220 [Lactobacillales bacterium]|jgi:lipopolysaccharide biosynthesis glycosyltransferase|nr:hypothetical protein [Lactobacillales bacterium]